ncbi:hypothetical protein ACVPTE_23205 [Salmonella enterica subsp. enterica serovar Winslow]|nr:hypothetical protein [Salmonella enterica subsp. enterica serovar Menston]MIX29425.1 hypothetical protein [Salmonella enterica subsp. enterica serovar Livingstone]
MAEIQYQQPDIDEKIKELVLCFNACGFITYASCQGHGFPVDRLKPYIAFTAPLPKVARLEKVLREDAESSTPQLNWGWWITGNFNVKFELCFSLVLANAPHWYMRYWRPALNQDLNRLSLMLRDTFQPD